MVHQTPAKLSYKYCLSNQMLRVNLSGVTHSTAIISFQPQILIMVSLSSVDIDPVKQDLQTRGFRIDNGQPTIARGGSMGLIEIDAPLEVTPVANSRPLTVLSAIANAASDGRIPLLVVDSHDRSAINALLSKPFGVADQRDGFRRFYATEQRIQLADDSFACVTTDEHLWWTEASGHREESPQLHLMAGDEPVVVLDAVEELACPAPSPTSFPNRYARDENGRFVLYNRAEAVGTYAGVSAMRSDGVKPVPAPLVPEDHLDPQARLPQATLLATADEETVQYTAVAQT